MASVSSVRNSAHSCRTDLRQLPDIGHRACPLRSPQQAAWLFRMRNRRWRGPAPSTVVIASRFLQATRWPSSLSVKRADTIWFQRRRNRMGTAVIREMLAERHVHPGPLPAPTGFPRPAGHLPDVTLAASKGYKADHEHGSDPLMISRRSMRVELLRQQTLPRKVQRTAIRRNAAAQRSENSGRTCQTWQIWVTPVRADDHQDAVPRLRASANPA